MIFIAMNVVAGFHAYKFTHFTVSSSERTNGSANLSTGEKIKALLFGVNNPRPSNNHSPSQTFEVITLQSNKSIECWSIKADSAKGTVILFHGYGGEKSSMLDKSDRVYRIRL